MYVAWPCLKRLFELFRRWWPWIATVLQLLWNFGTEWLPWLMHWMPPGTWSTVLIVVLALAAVCLVTKGVAAVIANWQLMLVYAWGEVVCEETEANIEAARPKPAPAPEHDHEHAD